MAAPIGACIALEVLSAEVVNSTSEMTIATEVKEMRPDDHCGLLHPEKQKRHFVEYKVTQDKVSPYVCFILITLPVCTGF